MVVLFCILSIAGYGMSCGISLRLILPVEPMWNPHLCIFRYCHRGLRLVVTLWFVARTLINKRLAQLHEKPRVLDFCHHRDGERGWGQYSPVRNMDPRAVV